MGRWREAPEGLVKLSDVQAGRIGEHLLAVYAMLTSDGVLVPFQVDADDDHRDLVVAVKGKSAFVSLQAKACFELGASGIVQSNATYFESTIPRDPSWMESSTHCRRLRNLCQARDWC
jgi:hypothetical protein